MLFPIALNYGSLHVGLSGERRGNGRFERGEISIGAGAGAVTIRGDDVKGNGLNEKAVPPEPAEWVQVAGKKRPFRLVDKRGGNEVSGTVEEMAKKETPREFKLSRSASNLSYAGGKLIVAGVEFDVVSVNGERVTVRQTPTLPFVIVDDDMESSSFLQNPPKGEDAQGGTPFELMQTSDDKNRNLFAVAYIKPTYDLGSGEKGQVAFKRNVRDPGADGGNKDLENQLRAGRDFTSSNRFWVVYLQGAFQGPAVHDLDPNKGSATQGATLGLKYDGSLIYVETQRDTQRVQSITDDQYLKKTVVHEVGHQFGLPDTATDPDKETDIMTQGFPVPLKFKVKNLKKLRATNHPMR